MSGESNVKRFKNFRLFLATALTVAVVSGCDPKPAAKPEASGTNTPPTSAAGGAFAAKPAGASSVSNLPLRTIISLKQDETTADDAALIRIRGTVLDARPGDYIVVHDKTGTVF